MDGDARHPPSDLTPGTRIPAAERRRLTIGLTINVSVIAFEALAVATVAPRAARDLGGLDLYGWTFSAFMLANLVGTVVSGHWADRRGPAPPYAVGLGLFTAGLLVCGTAPTMPIFVLGRAVQGLGAGALASIAYVAIGRGFDESERPRQFAILSSAWVIPGLIAPGLGGLIAENLGWRVVFLGLAALPAAATALALPPLRRLATAGHRDSDAPEVKLPIGAAIALAAGAGMVVEGLGADSAAVGVPVAVVGLVLGVNAFRRLTPPGTLRARRGMPAAIATRGFETFAFFGTDAFFALALSQVRDLNAVEVGLVLTPATFTWTIGSWIQARRAGRWSRRTLATAGVAFVAVGVAATAATVLAEGVPVWISGLVWGLGGLGMGLSYSPTSLVVLSEAGPGSEGAGTAAVQLTDVLGTALGTGLGGAIVATAMSRGWTRADALIVVFALMATAGVIGTTTARRFPRDPATLSVPVS